MLYIGIGLIILGIIFVICACVVAKKADEKIVENTNRSEKKLLRIVNHYGIMSQLKYFQSEVFELNEAIIKYENLHLQGKLKKEKLKRHIAEEIADVMVMLEQIKLYYDLPSTEIVDMFWYKVDRQIGRIERENIKKVEQCKK